MSVTTEAWCILRTAGSQTLPLARALRDAGFDAWAPISIRIDREGPARKRVEVEQPMAPSYVFAAFNRVADLVQLSHSPNMTWQAWDAEQRRMVSRGVPHFTVFRHLGKHPPIADRDLEPLRRIERASKPKGSLRVWTAGEAVRYSDAGFEGLAGTVVGLAGRYVVVSFPGLPVTVKIDARQLESAMNPA